MTEKLYYSDGHLSRFTARVTSCEKEDGTWAVKLDRSAFFPGGGGQEADEGVLSDMKLLGLREEGEDIVHLTPAPLEPGALVEGRIDWPLRFSRMQGHSGEHILSGTVHRLFGYDNVGFHMGEEAITIDFSGELSREDLSRAELEANRAIWRDVPVRTLLPTPGELAAMDYRSKKELTGQVRIVEIEGVDLCACCAPHVSHSGEVGLLKIIDSMRHRGGTRLTLLCGEAALLDYEALHENNAAVSAALSAKRLETGGAIARVMAEQEERRAEFTKLKRELLQLKAAALRPTEGSICIFESDIDMITLRELVNAGSELAGKVCAGFAGTDGDYKYIIGSRSVPLRARAKEINAAIDGRGGGSDAMIQGTSRARREDIERYFNALK
ncbi:MAG: DHHA1 domain-containing protein [Oscillospiraceae bacterium]|nr:DHHA1 domain-containing protein [Oscillospiraceae bacterium]